MNGDTGITLVEILIVIGLLTAIAGLSMLASIDMYRAHLFRGDRDMLIGVLQKARSRAMNNICLGSGCSDGKSHGVHFESDEYVIFQGAIYNVLDTLNERFSVNDVVVISGLENVVFSQLSGDAAPEGNITIADDAGHTSVITINGEGQILWTN